MTHIMDFSNCSNKMRIRIDLCWQAHCMGDVMSFPLRHIDKCMMSVCPVTVGA